MSDTPDEPRGAEGGRLALWTAVVLAVAGLLSAWASFQGGIWSGVESEHFHVANAKATESSELAVVARQREAENANLFVSWLEAQADNQPVRAAWLERQFDPPFAVEFRRWRDALPADIRKADASAGRPRFVGLLSGPARARAAEAQAEADAARHAGDTGDRYDRWTVVLATALFLAGIAAVVRSRRGQHLLVGLAAVLTVASLVALLALPVSFGA